MQKIVLSLFFVLKFVSPSKASSFVLGTSSNADSATVYYKRYLSTDSLILKINYLKKAQKFEVRDSVCLQLANLFSILQDQGLSAHFLKEGLPKKKKLVYTPIEEWIYILYATDLVATGKPKKAIRIYKKYENDSIRLHSKKAEIEEVVAYWRAEIGKLGKKIFFTPQDYVVAMSGNYGLGNFLKARQLMREAIKKYPKDGYLYFSISRYLKFQKKYVKANQYLKTALDLGYNFEYVKRNLQSSETLIMLQNLK